MSGDLRELTRTGRLANVLCRLAGSAFTGLVYAEHEAQSLVISMRDGHAVFVEDLAEQVSLSDALLAQGLVTKEQYANIAARVIESLADNEDMAFCRVAVEDGVLKQAEVDAEVERRVRGRLIQAVAWEQCRIELDDDPDALGDIFEYPQAIGPIVYMGVRTFFDDERVREVVGSEPVVYARLLRAPAEVAHFFQLESEEIALINDLPADVAIGSVIEDRAADSLEGWQLICMLLLADMAELAPTPFGPAAERSGVRSTRSMEGSAGGTEAFASREPRAGSQARMPVAREQPGTPASRSPASGAREERGAAPQGQRPAARDPLAYGSQARMPAVREEGSQAGSRPRIPVPREDPDERAAPREEYLTRGSRPRMPAARQEPSARAPQAHSSPIPSEHSGSARTAAQSAAPRTNSTLAGFQAVMVPRGAEDAARGEPADGAGRPGAGAGRDALDPSERAMQARKRPQRKLSTALQRLDRELKQARPGAAAPHSAAAAPSAPVEPPAAASAPANYAKAHVEQIVRMRQATLQKQAVGTKSEAKGGADWFREGQEALREQQFGRAHELLRKACEAEPNNEVYSMFSLWAAFRANTLQADDINKLRTSLREKVSDDQHKAFAYYALGHIALHEKKDDNAEKFFRKAIEFDRHNKDAERHLRVIDLRRKTAATERSNKIFGIEIGNKPKT